MSQIRNSEIPVQIDPGQYSFDPLHFEDNAGLTREEAVKEALACRNMVIRHIRKTRPDLVAKGWTLTGQLRQYKSFGVPDGRVRSVYYITVRKVGV